MTRLLVALLLLSVGSSAIAFLAVGWDKRCALRGRRRVRERTLHSLELAGGWPGSLLARRVFRHKTAKRSYRIAALLCAATHLVVLGGVGWAWWAAQ